MLFHLAGAEGMNLSPLFEPDSSSALRRNQSLFGGREREPEYLAIAILYSHV
jgi:hypothetical protein